MNDAKPTCGWNEAKPYRPPESEPPVRSSEMVSCGLPVKTLWERINQLAEACDLYEKALKTKCTCETAIGCNYCDNIIKARELSS